MRSFMGYFMAMAPGSFSLKDDLTAVFNGSRTGPSEFQVPVVLEYKILVNQRGTCCYFTEDMDPA